MAFNRLLKILALSVILIIPGMSVLTKTLNEWHIHPDANQLMYVVSGQGYYQEEGKPVRLIKAGDYVMTPANVKQTTVLLC